jgi:peptidyl-tRNA hydrolase, PTH1 family
MTDYVISGQGNPGKEHEGNRHNVGFWCIDTIARRHGIRLQGPRFWQRTPADAGKGAIEGAEVVLVKPTTYYNGTGRAVQRFLKQENVAASNLIVVYDDLDLPEGRMRIRPQGSHGGNNGLKSIAATIGSTEFGRIRVGVGRPWQNGVPSWDPDVVKDWLLNNPPRQSREALEAAAERVADAVEKIIRDGWERAMDTYNRAS